MLGFLFVDKPAGVTSFSCVKRIRKIVNVKQMGFLGTLDPLASGLMIFAVGEATKLIPLLEGADKVYDVTIELGAVSDTYDADGNIQKVEKKFDKPTRGIIEEILEKNFIGAKMQVPPVFSAIWVNGKRSYDLARKNVPVVLKPRKVTFYETKLKRYAWPLISLTTHVSSGTYVRSLAHDLGQMLGCGGYVKSLRRVKINNYRVQDAVKLDDLAGTNIAKYMQSILEIFSDYEQIVLNDKDYGILANGGFLENVLESEGERMKADVALAVYNNLCAGILEKVNSKLKFKRKLNIFI